MDTVDMFTVEQLTLNIDVKWSEIKALETPKCRLLVSSSML